MSRSSVSSAIDVVYRAAAARSSATAAAVARSFRAACAMPRRRQLTRRAMARARDPDHRLLVGHRARRRPHAARARGWRVSRHLPASRRTAPGCAAEGLESFPLDLADEAGVAGGRGRGARRGPAGRIDALVNNGAFAIPGAVEDLPRAALRAIFETNLFGQIDLTNRLLPAMRAAGARAGRDDLLGARPRRRALARRLCRDEVRARRDHRRAPARARRLRRRRRR